MYTECLRFITQAEKDWRWRQIMLAAIRETQERIGRARHAREELYNSLEMGGTVEELEDLGI
jgi:hypothetical protein